MLFVSHDRRFLAALSNRAGVDGPDGIHAYGGGYTEYVERAATERGSRPACLIALLLRGALKFLITTVPPAISPRDGILVQPRDDALAVRERPGRRSGLGFTMDRQLGGVLTMAGHLGRWGSACSSAACRPCRAGTWACPPACSWGACR